MLSEDYYKDHWDRFVFETTKLDELRNQDIKSVVPEFKHLL